MSFVRSMIDESRDLFARIYEHPFLQEVAAGTLSDRRLAFYFEQNVYYLDTAIRCRAIGVGKAQNHEMRDMFLGPMEIIAEELRAQEGFLKTMAARLDAPIAPTCHAYMGHILHLAWERDPVEYFSGFMACPLSYDRIGLRLAALDLRPRLAEWWEFSMSDEHHELCDSYIAFVDEYSADFDRPRLDRMRETFQISLNYEYMFWDMAYNMETWADVVPGLTEPA